MKKENRKPDSDRGNKFIEKPWDKSIGHSVLLDLMNAHFKHLLGEFHKEITQGALDRIFGKNSNLSREMLVFENDVGEIIGFTGISDISGTSPSWRLFVVILPKYYGTRLPQQAMEAGISMGKNLKIGELTTYGEGPLAAPFDQALENLGVYPNFYLFRMYLSDFADENTPPLTIPRGVSIRKLQDPDDYDQYVSVFNEAFRSVSGSKPTTVEKMQSIHEYRRTIREVNMVFAYEDDTGHLIGFCNIEYDPQTTKGWGRSLAVQPEFQHRGIGRYLAMEGINHLRTKNCPRIELEVVVDNENALGMYRSLGFQSIDQLKRKCYRIYPTSKYF